MTKIYKFDNGNRVVYQYAGDAWVEIKAMDGKPLTVAESVYLLEATKHNILTMMED